LSFTGADFLPEYFIQLVVEVLQLSLLNYETGHHHRLEEYRIGGVAAFWGEAPAHVHQLFEGFSVLFVQGSCEAVPIAGFLFRAIRLNSTILLRLHEISNVSYTREHELLFCEGFAD